MTKKLKFSVILLLMVITMTGCLVKPSDIKVKSNEEIKQEKEAKKQKETVVKKEKEESDEKENMKAVEGVLHKINPQFNLIEYTVEDKENSMSRLRKYNEHDNLLSMLAYDKDTKAMYLVNYNKPRSADNYEQIVITPLSNEEGLPKLYKNK